LISRLHVCTQFHASYFFFYLQETSDLYTLSLHDALPISHPAPQSLPAPCSREGCLPHAPAAWPHRGRAHHRLPHCGRMWQTAFRSEEHTSELQSQSNLVCRLLLEKKKNRRTEYDE